MSELQSRGEAKTSRVEIVKTTLTIDGEAFAKLQTGIKMELDFLQKAIAYKKAADELANFEPNIFGDIFEVSKSAEKVGEVIPKDNIYLLDDTPAEARGEFRIDHPALVGGDGSFGVDAIDLASNKIVVSGPGEDHLEFGSPISYFALIIDRTLPTQEVEVHIVKDTVNYPDSYEIIRPLIESLRTRPDEG